MATRKRAMLACTHCHRHKVRCDACTAGPPCTRCQEDGTACVLRQRASRRPSSAMTSFPGFDIIHEASAAQSTPSTIDRTEPRENAFVHYSQCPSLEPGDLSALDDADVAFLTAKKSLHVPPPDLLEDFLRQFFLHLQPYTPLIDESLFWSMYDNKSSHGQQRRIPLLLFQAMLFASSPYISSTTVQKCEFEDKRTAWTTLYQRAKLLYNSAIKVDWITRAQAALLLTFYSSAEDPQIANLWMAHSIQAANQASPKPQERSPNELRTIEVSQYDRLWWSILLRERILCLGLRRHPQVLSLEMNMINGLPNEREFEAEINGCRVYEPKTRRLLYVFFRELCYLAVLLTDALSLLYGHHGLSMPYLTSDDFHSRLARANSMQTSLDLWKRSSHIANAENVHESIVRFQRLSMMYFQAARINLAHYQAVLIEKHDEYLAGDYASLVYRAGSILLDAATSMTSTMEYFSRCGKIEESPLSLLGFLAMPLLLSAINFKLSPTTGAMQERRRLFECMGDVLTQSRRVYIVTDFISAEIDKMLQLAYYTSSKVFLTRRPRQQSVQASQTFTSSNIEKRQGQAGTTMSITSWHDAFLHHTRAYLLISTTVDHFMSVGRMPQLGIPPEYLCFMSPLDMMQVPLQGSLEVPAGDDSSTALKETHVSEQDRSGQSVSIESCDWGLKSFEYNSLICLETTKESSIKTNEYATGGEYEKRWDLDFLSFDQI